MKIPTKLSDISLVNYLKYVDYLKTKPKKDDEYIKNIVMIFYDLSILDFNKFKYNTILDMFKII